MIVIQRVAYFVCDEERESEREMRAIIFYNEQNKDFDVFLYIDNYE